MSTIAARCVTAPLRWWDIPRLVQLEATLFPGDSPWTAEMFWSELAAGHHYVVLRNGVENGDRNGTLHQDGAVVGYAGLAVHGEEAEVQTIGVDPMAQGGGRGRVLLEDLLRWAGDRRVLLEVRTDNVAALGLYTSVGFERIGLRRNYYQPSGADAYTMQRPAGSGLLR